ncbi:MAG: TetR/AcrR family transcriptional regulator [Clostridiaceae bacterium]|nr:TetR/AcrR family transcriptional regulator [Clostridiaceae bacterium]
MPRKSTYNKSEVTRESLRRTALLLFSEKGYSKVTIQMICEACGVATGLFYYYFPSKSAVIEESRKIGEPLFEELLQKAELPEETEAYIRTYFEIYAEVNLQLGTDIFMRVTPERGSGSQDETTRPTHIRLEKKIKEAQEKGLFRTEAEPVKIVQQLFTYVRGVIIDWCLSSGTYDLNSAIQTMLTPYLYYYILKPQRDQHF